MQKRDIALFFVGSEGVAVFALQGHRLDGLLVLGHLQVNGGQTLAALDQVEGGENPVVDFGLAVDGLPHELEELAQLVLALGLVQEAPEETLLLLVSRQVHDLSALGRS